MKQVIIFPRGQLTPKDKERLSKEGFVAVEADDPKSVVCAIPSVELLSGNDLFRAAIAALTSSYAGSSTQAQFCIQVGKMLDAKELKP